MTEASAAPTVTEPTPIELCRLEELTAGEVQRFADLDGLDAPIAVIAVGGDVYAMDDTCTHEEASLADGVLDGYCIECPYHSSTYDFRTGVPDAPPATRPVRRHSVSVVDGVVFVTLSADAPA